MKKRYIIMCIVSMLMFSNVSFAYVVGEQNALANMSRYDYIYILKFIVDEREFINYLGSPVILDFELANDGSFTIIPNTDVPVSAQYTNVNNNFYTDFITFNGATGWGTYDSVEYLQNYIDVKDGEYFFRQPQPQVILTEALGKIQMEQAITPTKQGGWIVGLAILSFLGLKKCYGEVVTLLRGL